MPVTGISQRCNQRERRLKGDGKDAHPVNDRSQGSDYVLNMNI